jgi:hypothetical protein
MAQSYYVEEVYVSWIQTFHPHINYDNIPTLLQGT